MNYNFVLGDTISRINVARLGKYKSVILKNTKFNRSLMRKLMEIGLVYGGFIQKNGIRLFLKYNDSQVNFKKLKLISKPGKRVFWRLKDIKRNVEKTSSRIFIISTRKGLMLGTDCIWSRQAGEPLFEIFL